MSSAGGDSDLSHVSTSSSETPHSTQQRWSISHRPIGKQQSLQDSHAAGSCDLAAATSSMRTNVVCVDIPCSRRLLPADGERQSDRGGQQRGQRKRQRQRIPSLPSLDSCLPVMAGSAKGFSCGLRPCVVVKKNEGVAGALGASLGLLRSYRHEAAPTRLEAIAIAFDRNRGLTLMRSRMGRFCQRDLGRLDRVS